MHSQPCRLARSNHRVKQSARPGTALASRSAWLSVVLDRARVAPGLAAAYPGRYMEHRPDVL